MYFGKDKEKALSKYREERDQLQAGITPRDGKTGSTLPEELRIVFSILRFCARLKSAGRQKAGRWIQL